MLSILDSIFILVILVVAVTATIKGFIKEVLGKASWVLAILCSIVFYKKLGTLFSETVKNEMIRNIISFVLIFILVFLVVKIIEVILSKVFSGEIVGGLNHALGCLLGIVEGFILVFAILFVMKSQPWIDISGLTEKSKITKIYEKIVEPKVDIEKLETGLFNDSEKI